MTLTETCASCRAELTDRDEIVKWFGMPIHATCVISAREGDAMTTYDVYRWNGELAFHIFPTTDEMPTAAVCGMAFPDTDAAREFWGLWRRQSGSLEDMRAFILANPLYNGHICAGCQTNA